MSACNRLLLPLEKHSRVYETPLTLRTECTQQAWYAPAACIPRWSLQAAVSACKGLANRLVARGIQADVVNEKARTATFILEAHVGESVGNG